MYRIIGADQQEYGPIAIEQVREWIAQGRVNINSRARLELDEAWKTLREFPEFAEDFARKEALPPGTGPSASPFNAVDIDAMAAQANSRGINIDAFSCISRSWDVVVKDFWLFVAAGIVGYIILSAVPLLLQGPVMGGLYWMFLKRIRGQTPQFEDLFAGFSAKFLPLFLLGIVCGLLQSVGYVLCILPGIYLTVVWMLATPLVMDRNLDFWPAMELSRKVIQRDFWSFLVLLILQAALGIVGVLALCIGFFVAFPVIVGAVAFAYEDIFGSTTSPTFPSAQ